MAAVAMPGCDEEELTTLIRPDRVVAWRAGVEDHFPPRIADVVRGAVDVPAAEVVR